MPRSSVFAALCLLCTAAFALAQNANFVPIRAEVTSSSVDNVKMRFDMSDLQPTEVVADGVPRASFMVDGEGAVIEPGRPMLPAVSRYLIVAPDANVGLFTSEDTPQRLFGQAPPLISNIEGATISGLPSDTTSLFPSNTAELGEPFVIRGVRFVKLTVYPVQYDYASHTYLLHPTLNAEVRSIPGNPINPVHNPIRKGKSREFRKFIEAYAENGTQFLRDDPDYDDEPEYIGKYCVATHASAIPYIQPWIEWKRKAGYKVDILSLQSPTDPSANKRAIQALYDSYINNGEDPFEYLLLVGDRNTYSYPPNAGWVLEAEAGETTWPNAQHADYKYGNLEGGQNDSHPDVAYGRWPGGSQQTLELMVGRTLAYQMTPNMQDTAWFTRGGVYSQHWGNSEQSAWHISIHTNVRYGVEVLQSLGYDSVRFHERYQWDQFGHEVGPFIVRLMNDKSNVLIGRAENYHFTNRDGGNHDFETEVHDNDVFPINLCTSGHGEWSAEIMFRRGSAAHLKGYVNVTFCWAGPMTMAESAIWADMVNGTLQRRMPVGWGFVYALNHFEKYFPNDLQWNNHPVGQLARTDNNHFGDPGMKPWYGVPKQYALDTPAEVSPRARMVEARVHLIDSDSPVPGARVTFYAPGAIPLNNGGQYAQYADMKTYNTVADENGVARMVLPEGVEFVNNTHLYVTLTGDSTVPVLHDLPIRGQQALVDLADWTMQQTEGNGDEVVNPGESFNLSLRAINAGQDNASGVMATVTSLSPWVVVDEANNITQFGDVASGAEADGDAVIVLHFSEAAPDATARPTSRPSILVEFQSNNQTWRSGLVFTPAAPRIVFYRVVGGNIIPDSVCTINVEVTNTGSISTGDVIRAELYKEKGDGVTVIDGITSFPSMNPGDTVRQNGGAFEIAGNKIVTPGALTRMGLVLTTALGFVDTTYFDLQVGRPRRGAPIGPDKYGYVCFDNGDSLWEKAPDYQWLEISTAVQDREYDGTAIEFPRQDQYNTGASVAIPLPFLTMFYGVLYDTITVSTNGFIGMGDQALITNYQNWPLDACIAGAVGMIAPFWDDLKMVDGTSNVFFYADTGAESNGVFIIEWYRMKPNTNDNYELTFQVVLQDHAIWPSQSGNQDILFQYKNITMGQNTRALDDGNQNANPYASVGISSPFGNSGINYTYRNQYPVGADTIKAGRALLFSTATEFKACKIYGWVTDAANGLAIPTATIYTQHGFVALTDETGYWEIPRALAELEFDITARKQGYNDSTLTIAEILEGDSLEIDFSLLHPEFTASTNHRETRLDPEHIRQLDFNLMNTGNGPLSWSVEKKLFGDANASPWQRRHRYAIGEAVGVDRIEGIAFGDNKFFIAGSRGSGNNWVWILDREGVPIDSFRQTNSPQAQRGYKDIEFDGVDLWGAGEDSVRRFDQFGNVLSAWECPPLNPTYNIAWDPDHRLLWLAGSTSRIYASTPEGELVDTLDRKVNRINGLAYWPEDPDGYNLYIVQQGTPTTTFDVYKMNIETNDTIRVRSYTDTTRNTANTGAFITNQYDVYSWVLMTIRANTGANGREIGDIYQLAARRDWFNLNQTSGLLQTGDLQDFQITFNTAGLPDTLFQGEFLFHHNADSGLFHFTVDLDVIGPEPPTPPMLISPPDNDSITALPFISDTLKLPELAFAWAPAYDANFNDSSITYRFNLISGANSLRPIIVQDTTLRIRLDSLSLPVSWAEPLEWYVEALSGQDVVVSPQRFTIHILPDAVNKRYLQPVEFGISAIYPSPFNGRTSISIGFDRSVKSSVVAYDLAGREAMRIFDGVPTVGYRRLTWDATKLASGIYIVQLESAGRTRVAKVALIK